jgi:isoaspartyl peptidase/L-asparaginase-like protein (Ntn-hydrolase superfamily)
MVASHRSNSWARFRRNPPAIGGYHAGMTQPRIVSTWSFGKRGNDAAWPQLLAGGASLDAVERVSITVEEDPEVDSVGFGGLPDAAGRVSLDGCIMHGPAPGRCGAVCALRRHLNAVSIARRVMEHTDHIMLAGEGADAFADREGFLPADLLAAQAQDSFEDWRRSKSDVDQSQDRQLRLVRPTDSGRGGQLFDRKRSKPQTTDESRWDGHDTIGVLAIDARGAMAGACSTSGTPYKLPGRVGDSPIVGHGLYVDPEVGGATATGTGEIIMGACASFLVVETMRRGASPLESIRIALERMARVNALKPHHQVAIIAMDRTGAWASAALRAGFLCSACDHEGSRIVEPNLVLLPE